MTDKNEAARRILAQCMKRGAKKIALYPYGSAGKRIEKELNDKYGAVPDLILDNGLVGGAMTQGFINLTT